MRVMIRWPATWRRRFRRCPTRCPPTRCPSSPRGWPRPRARSATRRRERRVLGLAPARRARGRRRQRAEPSAPVARGAARAHRGGDGARAGRRGGAAQALGRVSRVGRARRALGRPAGTRARPGSMDTAADASWRRLRRRRVVGHAAHAVSPTSGRTSGWLPATDMPRYVRELCDFVGFGESDAATVRASAPVVLEREAELTTALYDHFLKFPESARFFLGADGAPDAARIERRKHSLPRWLREPPRAEA